MTLEYRIWTTTTENMPVIICQYRKMTIKTNEINQSKYMMKELSVRLEERIWKKIKIQKTKITR